MAISERPGVYSSVEVTSTLSGTGSGKTEYVRWLYTAVTRASDRLYLLNFHPRFFGEED